jgi:hypothetical protein
MVGAIRTEFQFSGPYCFRWVGHYTAREISLYTTYHEVFARLAALADDAEGVIFHY